jgi:hypothetical protein
MNSCVDIKNKKKPISPLPKQEKDMVCGKSLKKLAVDR